MIDGLIHALASFERVSRTRETQNIDNHKCCHELEIAADPVLAQFLETMPLPDGRPLIDHLIEARNLYRDLNNIGKA